MATLPDHQGRGYGKRILRCYIEHIAREDGGLLWGSLRIAAVPFYEGFAFEVHDDVFASETGAPHRYGELMVPTGQ